MNKQKEKESGINRFFVFLFIPIAFCSIVNYRFVGRFGGNIYAGVLLISLLFCLFEGSNKKLQSIMRPAEYMYFTYLFLYVALQFLCGALSNKIYSLIFSTIIIFISFKAVVFSDEKTKNRVLLLSLICYAITAVLSYKVLLENPGAARVLASTDFEEYGFAEYLEKGLGGFQFIYSLVLILPCMLFMAKKSVGIKKIVFYGATAFFMLVILKGGYTIAIIIATIELVYYIIAVNVRNPWNRLFVFIIIILSLGFIRMLLLNFLPKIIDLFEATAVREHIKELYLVLQGKGDAEQIGRIKLYMMSIDNFFESPVFGRAMNYDIAVSEHSTILDLLAEGGLFCFIPYIFFWILWHRFVRRTCKSRLAKDIADISTVGFLILQVVNPVVENYQIIYTYMTVIPLGVYAIENEWGEKSEDCPS